MSSKVEQLRAQLNERILVLDGGMGILTKIDGDTRGGAALFIKNTGLC